MAFRVDREIFDTVGAGAQSGGSRVFQDKTSTAPWLDRPGQSKEQYIVSEALRIMSIPADAIRKQRPPVPYQLFPETMGYEHMPLTISDVLDTDRWSPKRRSWISGTVVAPRKADIQDNMWSGTARNMGMNVNPMG
jgi:hypothetical protein